MRAGHGWKAKVQIAPKTEALTMNEVAWLVAIVAGTVLFCAGAFLAVLVL